MDNQRVGFLVDFFRGKEITGFFKHQRYIFHYQSNFLGGAF